MTRARAGFTLVEVMVALAIIAVALLTLIVIRNNSVVEAQDAREITLAARLAQQKMGELEVLPVDEKTDGGNFEDWPDYRWTKEVALEVLETSQPGGTNQKPLEIWKTTLTVYWPGREKEESISVLSYRLKKEDEEPKTEEGSKAGGGQPGGGSQSKGGGS